MAWTRWAAVATGCRGDGGNHNRGATGAHGTDAGSGASASGTGALTIPCGPWSAGSRSSSYKATIKGLTQFGDRRQGTKRNRDAVDWIEAQLKSYGCTNTERITYMTRRLARADPNARAARRWRRRRQARRGCRGDRRRAAGGAGAGADRARRAQAAGQAAGRGLARRAKAAAGGGGGRGANVGRWPSRFATARAVRRCTAIAADRRVSADAARTRRRSTRGCASSTKSPRPRTIRPASGRTSTARRSARRVPTRCTSSARTWTATARAKPRTTTAPARRW